MSKPWGWDRRDERSLRGLLARLNGRWRVRRIHRARVKRLRSSRRS